MDGELSKTGRCHYCDRTIPIAPTYGYATVCHVVIGRNSHYAPCGYHPLVFSQEEQLSILDNDSLWEEIMTDSHQTTLALSIDPFECREFCTFATSCSCYDCCMNRAG